MCEMTYVYGTYCYIVYSCKRLETICMSIGSRLLNELWYTPTVKYYVVIKKNEETLYIRTGRSQRNIKWKKNKQGSEKCVWHATTWMKRIKFILTFYLICMKYFWKDRREKLWISLDCNLYPRLMEAEFVQALILKLTEGW